MSTHRPGSSVTHRRRCLHSPPSTGQPGQALSIDTLMATPFPTDLVAAPTGGAIAWVSSNSGVHNILIAEPSPGTGPMAGRTDHKWRAVTNYTGDDGLWITEPGFTSDAKTIVYVRGDGANRQGESPNPGATAGRHRSSGVRRSGRRRSTEASRTRQRRRAIAAGTARGVGIARTDLERRPRDRPMQPARLVNARGGASGLSWSPDGSMLAFTSGRGTHSYIGVFTLASKELRYIDPSLDRDGNAVWSPDGSRIAWIRQGAAPRRADVFAAPRSGRTVVAARRRREDRAWRSRSGRPMPVTAAPSRASSPTASCIGAPAIAWSSRGRRTAGCIFIPLPRRGGKATLLTPGNFEVEYVNIALERREDDLQLEPGRHRPAARLDGAGRRLGEAGAARGQESIGSEWQASVTSDGTTAMLHADAQHAAACDGDVAGRQRALACSRTCCRPASIPAALVDAAAGDDHRDRRHADPFAAVHAEGSQGRREAAGADLLPRRLAPPDAAQLALQLLLPQRLRDESVARQPGLHRAVGELSQRHRLRPGVPRGAQLRRVGRRRVQRRDGRRAVS